MSQSPDQLHPIKVVVRRAGISADLLRAWEKRYRAVVPVRNETGRRLYTDADIERLRLLREAMAAGRRIGDVATLPTAEITRLIAEDRERDRNEARALVSPSSAQFMADALSATRKADQAELHSVLSRALVALTPARFVSELATPFMYQLGELWLRGEITAGHEHAASEVVRRLISELMSMLRPADGSPVLVMATLSSQRHEIGAMFAATIAALDGWRVTYLGTDLPARDIGRVAVDSGALAIALSVTTIADPVFEDVAALRAVVGDTLPLFVGGQAASAFDSVAHQVTVVRNMEQFSVLLRQLTDS